MDIFTSNGVKILLVSGCLTHEGSHVANQAEQATFRRVWTAFTVADRENEQKWSQQQSNAVGRQTKRR